MLGHFVFVYIHPYMDGNGFMGRFLTNLMIAAGGYPWTGGPPQRAHRLHGSVRNSEHRRGHRPLADFLGCFLEKRLVGAALPEVPKASETVTHE